MFKTSSYGKTDGKTNCPQSLKVQVRLIYMVAFYIQYLNEHCILHKFTELESMTQFKGSLFLMCIVKPLFLRKIINQVIKY